MEEVVIILHSEIERSRIETPCRDGDFEGDFGEREISLALRLDDLALIKGFGSSLVVVVVGNIFAIFEVGTTLAEWISFSEQIFPI